MSEKIKILEINRDNGKQQIKSDNHGKKIFKPLDNAWFLDDTNSSTFNTDDLGNTIAKVNNNNNNNNNKNSQTSKNANSNFFTKRPDQLEQSKIEQSKTVKVRQNAIKIIENDDYDMTQLPLEIIELRKKDYFDNEKQKEEILEKLNYGSNKNNNTGQLVSTNKVDKKNVLEQDAIKDAYDSAFLEQDRSKSQSKNNIAVNLETPNTTINHKNQTNSFELNEKFDKKTTISNNVNELLKKTHDELSYDSSDLDDSDLDSKNNIVTVGIEPLAKNKKDNLRNISSNENSNTLISKDSNYGENNFEQDKSSTLIDEQGITEDIFKKWLKTVNRVEKLSAESREFNLEEKNKKLINNDDKKNHITDDPLASLPDGFVMPKNKKKIKNKLKNKKQNKKDKDKAIVLKAANDELIDNNSEHSILDDIVDEPIFNKKNQENVISETQVIPTEILLDNGLAIPSIANKITFDSDKEISSLESPEIMKAKNVSLDENTNLKKEGDIKSNDLAKNLGSEQSNFETDEVKIFNAQSNDDSEKNTSNFGDGKKTETVSATTAKKHKKNKTAELSETLEDTRIDQMLIEALNNTKDSIDIKETKKEQKALQKWARLRTKGYEKTFEIINQTMDTNRFNDKGYENDNEVIRDITIDNFTFGFDDENINEKTAVLNEYVDNKVEEKVDGDTLVVNNDDFTLANTSNDFDKGVLENYSQKMLIDKWGQEDTVVLIDKLMAEMGKANKKREDIANPNFDDFYSWFSASKTSKKISRIARKENRNLIKKK